MDRPIAPTCMTFDSLKEEALRALSEGGFGDALVHEGRVVAVKTSPSKGNGTGLAVGTAALPPAYETPSHSHWAEEVAVCLFGSGSVDIDGDVYPVSEGTVLVTPANSTHSTASSPDSPLVMLWFYAPPGSEARWLKGQ